MSEANTTKEAALNNDILVMQVRAFLEATEDVDIDVETVEDLMQTMPADFGLEDQSRIIDPSGDDYSDEDTNGQVDEFALCNAEDEAQQTWTAQGMKDMMGHLKECGMAAWIKEYVVNLGIPVPDLLRAFGINLCEGLRCKRPTTLLYFLKVAIARELRSRDRLTHYNTITDAVDLICLSSKILILTGAGISVSCGIPDFRSQDGLYASLKGRGEYDLDDPQQMFDINYFRENPDVFYSFAHRIYPSNFTPSPCHQFIKLVEDQGQLLRNYTQNIDTLETLAGVKRVLQCHGSFATATCLQCRRRVAVPGSKIEADILRQKVSLCDVCNPVISAPQKKKRRSKKKARGEWDSEDEDESDRPLYPSGIMKPDITFFGEKLADKFDELLEEDREKVDLLLIIGTSLNVSPVAEILSHLPHSVPQILINKTPIRHINPDIVLLGNADDIVQHLCNELSWQLPSPPSKLTQPSNGHLHLNPGHVFTSRLPERVGNSHVWLFDGAEGGKWLQDFRRKTQASQTQPMPAIGARVWSDSEVSGVATRISTAPSGGGDRKREFLDVTDHGMEGRELKRVRSEVHTSLNR